MKNTILASFLALSLFSACSISGSEPAPGLVDSEILNEVVKSSAYSDLISSGMDLDLQNARLGDFNHYQLLTLPIKMREDRGSNLGRFEKNQSHIVLKYTKYSGWTHFVRITQNGEFTSKNTTDFSGTLLVDDYRDEVILEIKYLEGEFKTYSVYGGVPEGRRKITAGRSEGTSSCESMCHVLDCVGKKFEEKTWFSKVLCTAGLAACIAADVADCIGEGCENSFYKECGDQ